MRKRVAVVLLWAMFGLYAYGTTMAYFTGEFPMLKPRSHVGIAAFMALGGPIGAFVSAFASNFNEYGWRLK